MKQARKRLKVSAGLSRAVLVRDRLKVKLARRGTCLPSTRYDCLTLMLSSNSPLPSESELLDSVLTQIRGRSYEAPQGNVDR